MHARVTTVHVSPERINEFIRYFRTTAVRTARQQPGFTDLMLFVDHHGGKCLVLSLWDSVAHRQATGATSDYLQRQIAPVIDFLTDTPLVEEYTPIVLE
jgi:quinol monooxygenase YgiN